MSGAKFYVLGGGRWRELDTSAGRVEGWGAARFLFVERGRLRAVRRAPVLRGLRALAAGRAQTARDGPPLSQVRHTKAVKEKRSQSERNVRCQHAYYGCGVNTQFNMQLPCARAVHAGVQTDLSQDLCRTESLALSLQAKKSREPVRNVAYKNLNKNIQKKRILKNKQSDIIVPHQNNVRLNSTDEDLSASITEWKRKRKAHEIRGAELCKELIIAEEDILLLRNYIEKDKKNLFNVDLKKFDADDTYKSKVFYKLNPLVNVERCNAIADMIWEQQSQSTVSLKDFITNLGLRRVDDPSPSRTSYRIRKKRDAHNPRESGAEQDKENLTSKRQPKVKKRPNKVLGESMGGKPNGDRVKSKVKSNDMTTGGSRRLEESVVVELSASDDALERTEPATPPAEAATRRKREGGGGREYSPAEDASIVRWLRAAGRGRLVNGNRLWRELQPEHQRLTGHCRGTPCATATCATCCRRWARCCRRRPPPRCGPPPPAGRSRSGATRCWRRRRRPCSAPGRAAPARPRTQPTETDHSMMNQTRLVRCCRATGRPRRRTRTLPLTRSSQNDSQNDIVPRPTRTHRRSPNPKRSNDDRLNGYVPAKTSTFRADRPKHLSVEPKIIITSTLPTNEPPDLAETPTRRADTPTTGARQSIPSTDASFAPVASTIIMFNNYNFSLKKGCIKH